MFNTNIYKQFIDKGFTVVPTHNKTPMGSGWQQGLSFDQISSAIEYHSKNGKEPDGVGLVMTDNLEALDFDTKHDDSGEMMESYRSIVVKERKELYDKIVVQRTQSGGEHWIYKCEKRDGNSKLAKNKKREAIIETRGIGGQIVIQPTPKYKFTKGGLSNISEISVEDRAYLFSVARTFNEYEDVNSLKVAKKSLGGGNTAFNDYNDKMTIGGLKTLFSSNGWNIARETSDKVAILRDGSTAEHSGYIFKDTLRSYVFSTSTSFESEKPYLPYAVYAILEHDGDYTAAARELYKKGFGEQEAKYAPSDFHENTNESVVDKKTRGRGYVPFDDYANLADELYKEGNPKGCDTRFNVGRKYMSYRKKYTTYVFAAPTSGKTEFCFSEMVYLSERYGWKWGVYSIESGEPQYILGQVASVYIGKKYSSEDVSLRMSPQEKSRAIEFYKKYFFVIDPLFNGVKDVVDEEYVIRESKYIEEFENIKLDGLYIDPVTELDDSSSQRIDQFIKRVNRTMNDDAKANNRHNILVYHVAGQAPVLDKDTGKTYFPEPHPREMAGGQNPYRQGHQIVSVFRPTAGMVDKLTGYEYLENETHIIIHKDRPTGIGRKGRYKLYFDRNSNRYYENPECTIYSDPIYTESQEALDLKPTYSLPVSKENVDLPFGAEEEEFNPFD